jgi:hypothetical protein
MVAHNYWSELDKHVAAAVAVVAGVVEVADLPAEGEVEEACFDRTER